MTDPKLQISKIGILGYGFAALEALCAVGLLATSAFLISRASQQPPILYLLVAVVGVRAFALGRATFRYLQRLALHSAVFKALGEIRPRLFEKLASLAPGGLPSQAASLERFTSDVERLQDGPLRVFVPLLQATTATATMFTIGVLVLPGAAMGLLASALTFAVTSVWLSTKSGGRVEEVRIETNQLLRSKVHSFVSQVDLITNYSWSTPMRTEISEIDKRLWQLDRKRIVPLAVASSLLSFGSAMTAIVGGWIAAINLGSFELVYLAGLILMPLALFDVYSQLQPISGALQGYRAAKSRIREVFSSELSEELTIPQGQIALGRVASISLQDVAINRRGLPVVSGVSLELEAGSLTAILGRSGSGKTSIGFVLASLISKKSGSFRINGLSASDYSLESRRRQVILIEQDPHLFRGTIRQNLIISGEQSEHEMHLALDQVGLTSEFEGRGLLEAEIAEDSANVSGGQAQRLAIARGLLAKASVLILDEPSSGLDRENSHALFGLLRKLANSGLIVIAITHDSELANLCDQKVSLDGLRQ